MSTTAPLERVEVINEPPTYHRHASHSFFQDLIDAERGEYGPTRRLERHREELRAHPDRVLGQGGYFAPPLWLIEDFASVPRPKRVLADLIQSFPLPQGAQSINIPRLTVGMAVASAQDDVALTPTDVTDAQTSSPVVAIAGYDDVSLQLLDQSPRGAHLDWVLFKDLNEAYDAQLETQLINGSGASGQLQGLIGLAGTTTTYTAATPSATGMYTYFGQAVAAIGINRRQPPEVWLMTTPRQAWIASSEDTQSRPLMIAGSPGAGEFQLVQFPVKLDDAIPRTLGAGNNQDAVIACKPSDMLLWESEPHTRVIFEPGSGTLEARIELHRYAAAILGRYPSGIVVLQGTGMVTPSGF